MEYEYGFHIATPTGRDIYINGWAKGRLKSIIVRRIKQLIAKHQGAYNIDFWHEEGSDFAHYEGFATVEDGVVSLTYEKIRDDEIIETPVVNKELDLHSVEFTVDVENDSTPKHIVGSAPSLEEAKDKAWDKTKNIAASFRRGYYTVTMTFEQNGEWLCSEEGTILVSYGGNVEVCA